MALKRWQFTREFKLQVLQEGDSGKSISQLARDHHVHPTLDPSLAATATPCDASSSNEQPDHPVELAGNHLLSQTSGNERLGTVKEYQNNNCS